VKKLILVSILLACSLTSYNQIIKGYVFDKETKKPVTYATVFFNGTSVATYTDENGFFRLDIKKNISMPLTVSALGYYSETINDFSPGKDLQVYIMPKLFEVDEVNISARGNPRIRRQNLEIFRREFLGRTENAKDCRIMNEDDIRFVTSRNEDTLKAFSLKPIIVINNGLGYRITYYLNKFEYVKPAYFHNLVGDFLFEEDTASILDRQNFISKRLSTYYGSKLHFLRSLYRNDLTRQGYSVNNNGKPLAYYEMVRYKLSTDPAQTKRYIHYSGSFPDTLTISWLPGKAESGMELFRDYIYFDATGYFRGPGIIWHGEMARQGIADLLPYEYQPPETINTFLYAGYETGDTLSPEPPEDEAAELREKIYLHTDKDYYNAGEDIWFKVYVVERLSHILSGSSGNLHVELISPDLKILESRIIRLKNGLGNGDFVLADTFKSGEYRIRAYTNYMRNFGDQLFFSKYITVVNSYDTTAVIADNVQYTDTNLEIGFFPEGGSLVDNVLTIVAFKAVDAGGSGCNVTGEVYSSAGNLMTSFRSSHLGMGTFSLKPVSGLSYFAIVRNAEGEEIRRDIPRSFPEGIVVNVSVGLKNNHIITLKTNPETLQKIHGRSLLLTISSHDKILKTHTLRIDSLFSTFVLPATQLPDGVLMLTFYDPDNIPLCERLVFVQNGDEVLMTLETDKTVYRQRDSVSVKLSLTENFVSAQEEAFLSLSATDIIYTDRTTQFPTNISSWFLLESDVRGPVEDPSYYFDPANENRFKDLDLLLLTQGWRDFEWKYNGTKYLYESGFTLSGRLRRYITDAPIINSSVTIGIFQDDRNIITTVPTDSSGRFRLDLENLTGYARVVVSAVDKKGNFQGRLVMDSLSYSPAQVSESERRKVIVVKGSKLKTENLTAIKENDIVRKTIRKKYTLSDTILIDEVQIIGIKKETPQEFHVNQARIVYGRPDEEVIITPQLESSRSIRDALIGKVAGITFVNPKTGSSASGIILRGAGSSFQSKGTDPLFLLDGIEVPYGLIESLPFNWIDRIDVIMSERAAAYGVRGTNGVISVITKTYKELPYQPVSYSVNSGISGYNAPRIFYSPRHDSSKQAGSTPDLRSTLYWFPDIKIVTNQEYKLKYFNADISSTYIIIVEGITSGGIPVSGRIEYEVK